MQPRTRVQSWPASADRLPLSTIARLTHISVGDLSHYRSGAKRMSSQTLSRITAVSGIEPDSYLASLRDPLTYSAVAIAFKREKETDPEWCIRLLARAMQLVDNLPTDAEVKAFHACPPKTGSPEWDAVLAAAAQLTWQKRLPHLECPGWTYSRRARGGGWSPFGELGTRASWEYLRTPIQFRDKGIILQRGELEAV